MAATIKDIAIRTGLGLATISKYLNGGTVRVENRAAIETAIRELDYTANVFARGLKTRRSKTIGIVIPELSNLFITTILTIVQDILRQSGYAILVCDCRTDAALEAQAVSFLVGKGVDGIINMPVSRDGSHLASALSKDLPIVLVDRMVTAHAARLDAVMVDNREASASAIRHLYENGHKEIGIIVGPADVYTAEQRLLGYRETIVAYGLPYDERKVRYSDYTIEGGYGPMKGLLRDFPGITAVLVTNYDMTLGAVMALGELGVQFPADLSLVGFDNMLLSRIVRPQLTIVEQPMEAIGRHAAELALSRLMDKEERPARVVTLPTQLRIGASVRQIDSPISK